MALSPEMLMNTESHLNLHNNLTFVQSVFPGNLPQLTIPTRNFFFWLISFHILNPKLKYFVLPSFIPSLTLFFPLSRFDFRIYIIFLLSEELSLIFLVKRRNRYMNNRFSQFYLRNLYFSFTFKEYFHWILLKYKIQPSKFKDLIGFMKRFMNPNQQLEGCSEVLQEEWWALAGFLSGWSVSPRIEDLTPVKGTYLGCKAQSLALVGTCMGGN